MEMATFRFLATLLIGVALSSSPMEAQPFAYVTNSISGIISVIDTDPASTDFNKVVSTIEVGMGPTGIAFTPDGTRAYVAQFHSSTISVMDTNPSSTDFNKVVFTIEVGMAPIDIAITPDGTHAYVTNRYSGTVSVIDTDPASADFNKVVSTVEVGSRPWGVAITPDGTRAYVTNIDSSGTVLVIDTDPSSTYYNKVVSTVEVGSGPHGVAITPDGARAYVTNRFSSTVSVIGTDPTSRNFNKVVSTIRRVPFPIGVAITPDGTRAYVTFTGGGGFTVIDTKTNTVIDTIDFGSSFPVSVAFTPDGTHAYVISFQDRARHETGGPYIISTVWVIDTWDNSLVDILTMEGGAFEVAITPSVDTDPDSTTLEIHRARVQLHRTANRDQFDMWGSFELEAAHDGMDMLYKDVTVTLGEYSETISGGDFAREGGEFRYKTDSEGITEFRIRDDGKFSVKARGVDLSSISLHNQVNPVNFYLQIGSYSGQTEIQFDRTGRFPRGKDGAE